MTQAISEIAQKALRRLGVRIVPLDDSPVFTEMVPFDAVVTSALVELGILNPGTALDTSSRQFDEIALAVLVELGVIASDETPSATDLAVANDKVASVHSSLQAKGITFWPNTAIPTGVAEEYIKLAATMAASSFGKTADPSIMALLEERARAFATAVNNNTIYVFDRVNSVHAALDAQGLVWWTGNVVPRAFYEEYVKLTVIHTSASFGKPTDMAAIAPLEARIRRGAMVISADDNANEAVQAVHDDLVMRGIARWTSLDIPDVVGEQMVILATERLAPLFPPQQIDPRAAVAAMAAIRRYIVLPTSGAPVQALYF